MEQSLAILSGNDPDIRHRHNELKLKILRAIYNEGGLTAQELIIRTGVKTKLQSMKWTLSKYSKYGYIYSTPSVNRRGRFRWHLAPRGLRIYNWLEEIHQKNLRTIDDKNHGKPTFGREVQTLKLDAHRPNDYKIKRGIMKESSATLSPERILELERKFRNIIS